MRLTGRVGRHACEAKLSIMAALLQKPTEAINFVKNIWPFIKILVEKKRDLGK